MPNVKPRIKIILTYEDGEVLDQFAIEPTDQQLAYMQNAVQLADAVTGRIEDFFEVFHGID
jgi:hypothetical protein